MQRSQPAKLNDRHLAVLREFEEEGGLLWSQLTQGPLRHCAAARRRRIVNDLLRWGLMESEEKKPRRGRTAAFYRRTLAGRAAALAASTRLDPGSLASSNRSTARI